MTSFLKESITMLSNAILVAWVKMKQYQHQSFIQIVVSQFLIISTYLAELMLLLLNTHAAMAHLKLKTWSNAESDASHALAIDNGHSKSYHRRCVARQSLGKLRAAMIDAYTAEDCLGDIDTKAVNELQQKVYRALVNAVKRAPRRKITVEVNECTE